MNTKRTVLLAPTDLRWENLVEGAKAIDASLRADWRNCVRSFDGDLHLCAAQEQQRREGYMMVEVSTNIYGYCVRDTMNDGAGTIYGGRSRRGTTREEAIAWAAQWHAERPTHRAVILGYERTQS